MHHSQEYKSGHKEVTDVDILWITVGVDDRGSGFDGTSWNGSTAFTNCIAHGATTIPSSVSKLIGLPPSAHGVWTPSDVLPAEAQTFAQRLGSAGYETVLVDESRVPLDAMNCTRGFDEQCGTGKNGEGSVFEDLRDQKRNWDSDRYVYVQLDRLTDATEQKVATFVAEWMDIDRARVAVLTAATTDPSGPHPCSPHPAGANVPLVIWGVDDSPSECTQIVQPADIMATLVDWTIERGSTKLSEADPVRSREVAYTQQREPDSDQAAIELERATGIESFRSESLVTTAHNSTNWYVMSDVDDVLFERSDHQVSKSDDSMTRNLFRRETSSWLRESGSSPMANRKEQLRDLGYL